MNKNVYIQEEKALPGQVLVPYEKPLVDAVESLIRLARKAGYNSPVETDKQWEVIDRIFIMWATLYPQEYQDFKRTQAQQKGKQLNKHAASREGEAMVQHLVEIPGKFDSLIKAIFPMQKTQDSKFVRKLAKRMKLLKMPESDI